MTGERTAWAIASGLMFGASTALSVLSYKAPNAVQAALLAAATCLLVAGIAFWVMWGSRGQQQHPGRQHRY